MVTRPEIITFQPNEGPLDPSEENTLFTNEITHDGDGFALQYWKVSIIQSDGTEVETICTDRVNTDIEFGIRNVPDSGLRETCDPEPGVQDFNYILGDVGETLYLGFKTWTDDQNEPEYNPPDEPGSGMGPVQTWKVELEGAQEPPEEEPPQEDPPEEEPPQEDPPQEDPPQEDPDPTPEPSPPDEEVGDMVAAGVMAAAGISGFLVSDSGIDL
jgi:hypothetical protein